MALTETQHTGEFLVSEANGTLSRETGVLTSRPAMYLDGTVLGISGGKLIALSGSVAASDVKGILYGNYDASDGDVDAVYIARLAEVDDSLVLYSSGEKADEVAGLALLNIRVR